MIVSILKYFGLYAFVVLIQLFILNNLFIGGSYSFLFQPQIIVLFLLLIPATVSHVWLIIISFLAGYVYDVFFNCWGIHASVSTLIGFTRYYFTRDIETVIAARDEDNQIWTSKKGNTWKWTYFLVFTAVYHFVYLLIQSGWGNFFDRMLPAFLSSTIITFFLVLIFENILFKPSRN
jgi:hypothetical protein